MITQNEIKVTDSGNGYVIGELQEGHKVLTYLKPGALVCLFDGVDTLLSTVASKMPTAKRAKSSEKENYGGFNAFNSYAEAMETFRNKPESVVKFEAAELRIKDTSESGTQVDFDVTGDFIDMGRYMEGIPEVMGQMHNGNARNRRVNLMVNLNYSGGTNHKEILARSERVLRLVDALEAGGVRTQVIGIESTECGHTEVILKRHDEPLTISDLAVVTHSEFLRRIIFRINEQSKTWEGGYGSSVNFSHRMTPEIIEGDNNNEMDIVIDANLRGETTQRGFDQLERLLVWEMSKPVPEVSSIKLDTNGIFFNPNGARDDDSIRREGQEVINEK